jgi:hypothetical protein
MKRMMMAGLLALAVLAGAQQKASANFCFNFSLGANCSFEWSGFCCGFWCCPNPCSSCGPPCCYCPPVPYGGCPAPSYGGYLPPAGPACDPAVAYGYGAAPGYAPQAAPSTAPQPAGYGQNGTYQVGYYPQGGYGAAPSYWYGR